MAFTSKTIFQAASNLFSAPIFIQNTKSKDRSASPALANLAILILEEPVIIFIQFLFWGNEKEYTVMESVFFYAFLGPTNMAVQLFLFKRGDLFSGNSHVLKLFYHPFSFPQSRNQYPVKRYLLQLL